MSADKLKAAGDTNAKRAGVSIKEDKSSSGSSSRPGTRDAS